MFLKIKVMGHEDADHEVLLNLNAIAYIRQYPDEDFCRIGLTLNVNAATPSEIFAPYPLNHLEEAVTKRTVVC